ncbi:MAG: hypothetical protein K6G30_12905, partial [Acetatifactor sp.]|nr:hypothetical protein [Acetatifactor sp.]
MDRKVKVLGMIALSVLMLAGCGGSKIPDVISETSLAVGSDGEITYYLVEDFDKEYYDISELTEMAMDDAATFCEKYDSEVQKAVMAVKKVEFVADNPEKVILTYEYENYKVFEAHTDGVLFFGPVS